MVLSSLSLKNGGERPPERIRMSGFILFIHFTVCIFMIIVILLQAGKGADIGATFGGSSQNVFGARGAATFLSKITTVAAAIFLVTSIYLANLSKQKSSSSVIQGMSIPPKAPLAESAPAESQAESKAAESKKAETTAPVTNKVKTSESKPKN